MKHIFLFFLLFLLMSACGTRESSPVNSGSLLPSNMFEYNDNIEPRWVSFENAKGEKGRGGMENNGVRHACD
ncbi:MAG: hypothetical protein IPN67_21145 [Bacteroidales bacterium]|nr:hypothetical protein [Bacteroidales bacterium]